MSSPVSFSDSFNGKISFGKFEIVVRNVVLVTSGDSVVEEIGAEVVVVGFGLLEVELMGVFGGAVVVVVVGFAVVTVVAKGFDVVFTVVVTLSSGFFVTGLGVNVEVFCVVVSAGLACVESKGFVTGIVVEVVWEEVADVTGRFVAATGFLFVGLEVEMEEASVVELAGLSFVGRGLDEEGLLAKVL